MTTGSRPGFRPEVPSSSLPRKGLRTLAGEAFVFCGAPEPEERDTFHLTFVRFQQRSQQDKGVLRSHTDMGVKVFPRAAAPLSFTRRELDYFTLSHCGDSWQLLAVSIYGRENRQRSRG